MLKFHSCQSFQCFHTAVVSGKKEETIRFLQQNHVLYISTLSSKLPENRMVIIVYKNQHPHCNLQMLFTLFLLLLTFQCLPSTLS